MLGEIKNFKRKKMNLFLLLLIMEEGEEVL